MQRRRLVPVPAPVKRAANSAKANASQRVKALVIVARVSGIPALICKSSLPSGVCSRPALLNKTFRPMQVFLDGGSLRGLSIGFLGKPRTA